MRCVCVAGRPVHRNRKCARSQIGFGIDQRPAMRIKDIGVEHVDRIEHERSSDPSHVPDRKLSVAVVDPAYAAQVEHERVGENHRQDPEPEEHDRRLAPVRRRFGAGHGSGVYQCTSFAGSSRFVTSLFGRSMLV